MVDRARAVPRVLESPCL